MDQKSSSQPGRQRRPSQPGFTPQQTVIIVTVAILGLVMLTLAAIVLFPPVTPRPVPTTIAQVSTIEQNKAFTASTGTPHSPVPSGCAQRNTGYSLGSAAHVVDANTIEVQVDGKTVRVSFAGLATIPDGPSADLAVQQAREMIEGQSVILVRDASDQDSSGRWVRYVFAGSIFVNFELVRLGAAKLTPNSPDKACANILQQAEQQARIAHLGLWLATPAPTATFMPFVTVAPAIPSGCVCSSQTTCDNFSTHAKAQACFNACNDYSSRLDEDHDGLACEELP